MMGTIIRSPKSEAESVKRLYYFLSDKESAEVEAVELYEEIDREFGDLQADMESVEEQVEVAEQEAKELKEGMEELFKNFKKMKRSEIYAEMERLLL